MKAYFRANHAYRDESARVALVKRDAAKGGAKLTDAEARRLVEGIWWKNTQENLAHMGRGGRTALPLVEDMIASITAVLLETGAIDADTDRRQPQLPLQRVDLGRPGQLPPRRLGGDRPRDAAAGPVGTRSGSRSWRRAPPTPRRSSSPAAPIGLTERSKALL